MAESKLARNGRSNRKDVATRRVLVIDDDSKVGDTARMILEAEGFDVVVALDGLHGLKAMQALRFDLAIVDLFMPGMDGLQTTKELRQLDPGMPIIAVSGFMFPGECPEMPHFSLMAKEAGAFATLYKPFRRHKLLQVIRDVMGAG
jgi:CheY-like chemotaxis protein